MTDNRHLDPVNLKLLSERLKRFNRVRGPRVGDFIHLPRTNPRQGEWTRITHDWGDTLQTGGMEGSYHFPGNYLSYSGGLDSGVDHADLVPTTETKPGSCWIFDRDISGAGRGVNFIIPCRVFTLRPGARLDGLGELSCPFSLTCLDAAGHARTCNYWYCISHHGMSHTAFTTEAQLHEWLAKERLVLAKPLPPHGEHSCIGLDYE